LTRDPITKDTIYTEIPDSVSLWPPRIDILKAPSNYCWRSIWIWMGH